MYGPSWDCQQRIGENRKSDQIFLIFEVKIDYHIQLNIGKMNTTDEWPQHLLPMVTGQKPTQPTKAQTNEQQTMNTPLNIKQPETVI